MPLRKRDRRGGKWRPPGSGPDFVNGVILAETTLSASELLAVSHDVEAALGRTRRQRWEARIIDLDLIDYDGQVLPDHETWITWANLPAKDQQTVAPDGLILPHPRVQDRAFVLVPLATAVPDWTHPVTGQPVSAMIKALDAGDVAVVTPL